MRMGPTFATLARRELGYRPPVAVITAINIYPVKSCRGTALTHALVTETGFQYDREWMIVRPDGRFLTQREEPRLAMIEPNLTAFALEFEAPDMDEIRVPLDHQGKAVEVTVWKDTCAALDAGDHIASWLTAYLGSEHRLVRFDRSQRRPSDPKWTGGVEAQSLFSDGFPWLMISQASLDDLNSRLEQKLPMNRFRPNIVIDGVPPYGEDEPKDFVSANGVRLRGVKPCTRCAITTTDQSTGERSDEPLRTLRSYRMSREPMGLIFGQNMILIDGAGRELSVSDQLHSQTRS
jgi:uncharacterized protein YcbX